MEWFTGNNHYCDFSHYICFTLLYRLDYFPPFGYPVPNTTIASKDIRDAIKFSQALPGTKYDFWLYYSNATHNTLTWTANFTTGTDVIIFYSESEFLLNIYI